MCFGHCGGLLVGQALGEESVMREVTLLPKDDIVLTLDLDDLSLGLIPYFSRIAFRMVV